MRSQEFFEESFYARLLLPTHGLEMGAALGSEDFFIQEPLNQKGSTGPLAPNRNSS
ncbi:MAG: hypothetical protein UX72_C0011G0017 [Parcubacteria group bacterium GW2011_GWA2_47_10]|nr:MAG: hypothetical protein UX72_C0011G0017 [Parcubacteria group bacterium GW2011_GWA2_47_10]